ncbi:MAG: fumarylacetoacetate hydrolase family protein [Candidatus Omnitrophica bacterium]|nr:fumarylacetoacetate hydrolase family protein [Candidatus Omnitrophota bacterium]
MRIVRIYYKGKPKWGVIKKETVHLLEGTPFGRIKYSGQTVAQKNAKLLAPAIPSKIIMAGLNYREHAKELGLKIPKVPVLFLKPPTSIAASGENIIYPDGIKRLDYEAELAFIVKKTARNIPENKAGEYILGYTCCNDVTARDLQKKDGQWTRAKSFDTFCPIGPHIETQIRPENLAIRSYLNGRLRQNSSTSDFIFPVYYLLAFVSRIMTLLPGDVVSTGTPHGIGRMNKGDLIEVEISGIGRLRNRVA